VVTTEKTRLDPAEVRVALVLVLGAIAPLLDSTIVNVALRTLGRALHAPVADIQWVTTGYLLTFALAVPVTAWAAERFGGKRVWLFSLGLFLLGSVLCGLSWNLASLIAFRLLQGIGGGLMIPVLQTLLVRSVGSRDRLGRLMAVATIPAVAAPIFGPVIGGLIVGHASWRWIFYVNVPVCLLGGFLAWRVLPADATADGDAGPGRARLDLPGLLLLSPGLAALLFGLSSVGTDGGFGHPGVVVPLAAGAALVAAFTVRAVASGTAHPLIDLSLFRVRSFSAASAVMFIVGISMYGPLLLLPLYYQQVRGASVVLAGLLMAPQGVGSLLARGAGGLTDKFGARPVLLGSLAVTALGTLPFLFTADGLNPVLLGAALVVRGAGLSTVNIAVMTGAFRDLSREQVPHASMATRIAQQLGASFGTAVLAVILASQLAAHPGAAAVAYGHTFGWALALTLVAFIPVLALPRRALTARLSIGTLLK
jgi:EmrB/QacA subfamily drug resistance transporter